MESLTSYSDVNDAWGNVKLPPVTAAEAKPIFDKLLKKFGGKHLRGPWWSHRVNRAWAAPKGTDTQYARGNGLPRMVHDASHWVFERRHGKRWFKAHSARHAALELEMIQHVLAKGWHLPKPVKAAPPKPSPVEARSAKLDATRASIKRWETKAKRAATALRKLRARERGLARALNAGHVQTAGKVIHMPLI
jgi:hypothetical protein